jgi:uncharacterized protein YdeI (YjbR/CyaY-like superfamily)
LSGAEATQTSRKIEDYLARHAGWSATLGALRDIMRSASLEETVKWGIPTYTLEGKNLISLAAFKNHAAIWFMQGALLEDPAGKLVNAQQGKTRAQRQWRFEPGEPVDKALVRRYVMETVENQKSGRRVKPEKQKRPDPPPELLEALKAQPALATAFEQLTPYKQREYLQFIAEAKRAATRSNRLSKITPMILAGKGLNDRYR